jgi:hypothetical protein
MNLKMTRERSSISLIQLSAGFGGLLLGLFLYLVFRSPEETYFIHRTGFAHSGLNSFVAHTLCQPAGSLPSFLHVFSFSVLTACVLASQEIGCFVVTLIWFFTNAFFEVGQGFGGWFTGVFSWTSGIPVLENTENFFARGTYDPLDLVAAAVGAAGAYLFLSSTLRRRGVS